MLRKLKKTDIKKVMWLLVFTIIPAFILWGASSFLRAKRNYYAAKVFNRKISAKEMQNFMRLFGLFLNIQLGRELVEKIPPQVLMAQLWNTLLLIEKAKKDKIEVSDRELLKKIENLPRFVDSGGKFQKEQYLNFLKRYGIIPSYFEEFLRDILRAEKLKRKLWSRITVSPQEVRKLYLTHNQQIKIKYVGAEVKTLKKEINPSLEELKTFFKENKKKFQVPLKVKIAYIKLENPQPQILTRILKFARKEGSLEKAIEKLKNSFEELKKVQVEFSNFFSFTEPIKGLGWEKEITASALFSQLHQIQGPYLTQDGKTVIFQKIGEKKSYIPEFGKITKEITEKFKEQKALERAEEIINQVLEKIKEKEIKDLAQVSKYFPQLKAKETKYFTLSGYIENIGLASNLPQKLFSLKEGEILPQPVRLSRGIYLFQLLEIKPVDEEKYEKEKKFYKQKIVFFKREKILNDCLQNLIKNGALVIYSTSSNRPK